MVLAFLKSRPILVKNVLALFSYRGVLFDLTLGGTSSSSRGTLNSNYITVFRKMVISDSVSSDELQTAIPEVFEDVKKENTEHPYVLQLSFFLYSLPSSIMSDELKTQRSEFITPLEKAIIKK
jgi:hypothetical protein